MADNKNLVKFRARISYVHLAEAARPMDDQGNETPKFKIECRIPKDDAKTLKSIRAAMKEAYVAKFGTDKKQWKPIFREDGFFDEHLSIDGKDGFLLRDGKYHSSEDPSYENEVFFSASNKTRPTCGKLVKGGWKRISDPEDIREVLYSGCYADVVIQVYAFDNKQAKSTGVGASLQAVVFAEDGERLGGGRMSDKDMNDLFGEEADPEAEDDDLLV